MTELQERAWLLLKKHGPMRGSDLGWLLWGETTEAPNRGTGSHGGNKFCRAAGKVLRALEREGKAYWRVKETYTEWVAIGRSAALKT